ncbi:MAG: thiol-disulfide oxidoreductase DCC family protein [Opitutales bacterium]
MTASKYPILFFDGECGFCTRSVRFLMIIDRQATLCFAPLQGETAKERLPETLRESLSTVVYCRPTPTGDPDVLLRSDAILYAMIDTGNCTRCFARAALSLPKNFRDSAYNWIAKNRRFLVPGKACKLPSKRKREQLLP